MLCSIKWSSIICWLVSPIIITWPSTVSLHYMTHTTARSVLSEISFARRIMWFITVHWAYAHLITFILVWLSVWLSFPIIKSCTGRWQRAQGIRCCFRALCLLLHPGWACRWMSSTSWVSSSLWPRRWCWGRLHRTCWVDHSPGGFGLLGKFWQPATGSSLCQIIFWWSLLLAEKIVMKR